ncbi:MAG TPA: TIGR03557 family F420-dependent LLM class oxidoreductase [Methanocella sp.]|nr:TIGR03557 family F420-dependent LLM class oxidoreductase [Methanocella sp.]
MLGWKAGPEQYDPLELLGQAIAAEKAGFESINMSDHFHPWDPAGQACNTWTWMGAAAARLKGIEIGTGVTCPILRYNPAIIAQAAATVDRMNPGPVYLGVGTGEALNEFPCTGNWPGYKERQDMVRESMELIRLLWSGDEITFQGDYYATRKARLYTAPRRNIPIYISSLVPESAFFAGYYGDGLITGTSPPEVMKAIMAEFDAGAREAGKDPAGMPRQIECFVAYTDDEDAAIKAYKQYWAGTMVMAMYLQNIYTPQMSARNGAIAGTDTVKARVCISRDPEVHAKFAQRFIDAGFNRVYFHCAGPDQYEFIEGYGRDVLPIIRERNRQYVAAPV